MLGLRPVEDEFQGRPRSRLRLESRRSQLILVACLITLGLGLRLFHYTRAPSALDNADESAWAWSGLTLLTKHVPYAWSFLPAYKSPVPYNQFPLIRNPPYLIVHP